VVGYPETECGSLAVRPLSDNATFSSRMLFPLLISRLYHQAIENKLAPRLHISGLEILRLAVDEQQIGTQYAQRSDD
jgi:hypothetical protein